MKRIPKLFSLLLVLSILLGAFTMLAAAESLDSEAVAEAMDADTAMEYLDSYSDNVASDENFDANITEAITVARESVGVYATFWALLPPVIAIALALITKEVYSSLFIGILAGALLNSNCNPWGMVTFTTDTLIGAVSDSWNVGILVFLVLLGMIVILVNKAGGSAAYGRWASEHIHTKGGAQAATLGLGAVIFIDDYFNCLTVGSVMRPVTDKFKISREKLAYIIDSTAAPVCIIAPISSWAAAVSSVAPEGQGLSLFIRSIPYNLYALLTLGTVLYLSLTGLDYGKMLKAEAAAAQKEIAKTEEVSASRGKVLDLVVPIVILIVCCITTMIYTGGFFDAESGTVISSCEAAANIPIIDFLLYDQAGYVQLYGPHNAANTVKNFKCDGKSIDPQDGSWNAFYNPDEGIITCFRVLKPENEAEKAIIDAYESGTIIELNEDFFAGVSEPTSKAPRVYRSANDDGYSNSHFSLDRYPYGWVRNFTTGKNGIIKVTAMPKEAVNGRIPDLQFDIIWSK